MTQVNIKLRRAKNYKNADGTLIEKVAKKVLLYGEPIYLEELDALLIGDGTSDVQTLYESNEYFAKTKNPTLYNATINNADLHGQVKYFHVNSGETEESDIPLTQNDELVANTKFVQAVADTKMDKANPTGTGSLSINRRANTTIGENSVAIGNNNTASGMYSFAEGANNVASGNCSHAEGNSSTASGSYSHAEGNYTKASNTGSHAEGYNTTASGEYSHTEGNFTTASNVYAHAEGAYTVASGQEAHAEGQNTKAYSNWTHAEGLQTIASSEAQHVQGKYNIEDSSSTYADIIGNGTAVKARSNAYALTWTGDSYYAGDIYTDADFSTSPATGTRVVKETAIANEWSQGSYAVGDVVYYEGTLYRCIASTASATNAKPTNTTYWEPCTITSASKTGLDLKMDKANPTGTGSLSINRKANSEVGTNSVAIGNNNTASGTNSFAEGSNTISSGECSHAENAATIAGGSSSHAEGFGTNAGGDNSHAEGSVTAASGSTSHAEGYSSTASASFAHVEGEFTAASSEAQHVQGKYNISDSSSVYADIIGNGTESARSNAYALKWDGNAYYAGDIYANSDFSTSPATGDRLVKESVLANEWKAAAYSVGDVVFYNGKLYRCIEAVAATSTATPDKNTTNWTACTLKESIANPGTSTPNMDGTAAVGTSSLYAHEDHVHPTDTTRAAVSSPALEGTPTTPTPDGKTAKQIANVDYVVTSINNNNDTYCPFIFDSTVSTAAEIETAHPSATTRRFVIDNEHRLWFSAQIDGTWGWHLVASTWGDN